MGFMVFKSSFPEMLLAFERCSSCFFVNLVGEVRR